MLDTQAPAFEGLLVNGSPLYTIDDFKLLQRYAILDPDREKVQSQDEASAVAFAHALALKALDEEDCAADYADFALTYLDEAIALSSVYPFQASIQSLGRCTLPAIRRGPAWEARCAQTTWGHFTIWAILFRRTIAWQPSCTVRQRGWAAISPW